MSGEKKQPSDELQDKIHFLFNNLSTNTMQQKVMNVNMFSVYILSLSLSLTHTHTHTHTHTQVEEFNSLVDEEYYDWVAQYLVMKRTSIEPNFHCLYMNCLDTINKSRLNKAVLRETYRNIKVR